MDNLSDRLRVVRRKAGLSQQGLAELSRTTQAAIQKIENGHSLRPRKIKEIASALKVKPGWLLFGEVENGIHVADLEYVKSAVIYAFGKKPIASDGGLTVSVAGYTRLADAVNKLLVDVGKKSNHEERTCNSN